MRVYAKETIWDLETYLFKTQVVDVTGDFAEHIHEFFEIFVVLDGTAKHKIANYIYPLQRGDVYVIKGNTPHAFLDAKNLRVCNISYDARIFLGTENLLESSAFAELFLQEPRLREKISYPSVLHLADDTLDFLHALCLRCTEQYARRQPGYVSCIRLCFLTMVSLLLQGYELQRAANPGNFTILHQATRFINEHASKAITVPVIASAVHISPRQLNRIFHRYYKLSVSEHLQLLRLSRAAELLAKTALPVQEVARMCAYADASYFARCFKKSFGKTPQRFRDTHQSQ